MTTLTARGMQVEREGDGDAVIMIHGLGGTSNTWQPLLPALSGMDVIRPDLPGAGRSAVPEGPIDVALLVSSLAAMLDDLAIASAHVVGHSFGTLLAQHLGMKRPDLVRSLLLFGPIIEPADAARERLRGRAKLVREKGMAAVADQVTAGGMAAGAAETNAAAFAFVRESHMRQSAEGFARSCEALAGARRADPAALRMPVMIVTGEEDGVSPPQAAWQLSEDIGAAPVRILPACGHWAPLEKPDECKRIATAFLREGLNQ